jgi:O-acetyl-ADP-ribose deacetylase (regulator of RNase III)
MSTIRYLKGDATRPRGDGTRIICHICNDVGAWGAGFVLALSAKWSEPEEMYRESTDRALGNVQMVEVEDGILVANMIAQHNVRPDENGLPPIRYSALRKCLITVNGLAEQINATLHMPRIGAGLAGGRWEDIEKIIQESTTVPVYVYDLK